MGVISLDVAVAVGRLVGVVALDVAELDAVRPAVGIPVFLTFLLIYNWKKSLKLDYH